MKTLALLLGLLLFASACAGAAPTPVPQASTATVTVPLPTATPTPPPLEPTTPPASVQGLTRAQVNVRSGPGTGYASLGLIDPGTQVEILGRDAGGNWYLIAYPSAPDGSGWVTAAFVQAADATAVPLLAPSATSTPAGPTGVVLQKLNVRSGPGTSYDSLGMLEAQSLVTLTGKNAGATWLQIAYPSAPGGHGWVTAAYVRVAYTSALPALDDNGNPLPSGTPAGSPGPRLSPTPTVGPAPDNGDSAARPALQVTFSPAGSRRFAYSHQLSAPNGDGQDWIAFTPYASAGVIARLSASLACSGPGALTVELLLGGSPAPAWGSLQCGATDVPLALAAGGSYVFHLSAAGSGPVLVAYTLRVQNAP